MSINLKKQDSVEIHEVSLNQHDRATSVEVDTRPEKTSPFVINPDGRRPPQIYVDQYHFLSSVSYQSLFTKSAETLCNMYV